MHGVPTTFIAELAHPGCDSYDRSSLHTGIMAGSLCPVEVMKQVNTRMYLREMTICYGTIETAPVSFQSTTGDLLEKRVRTVGQVQPHVECKIIDPATGAVVRRGETGELLSRGYLLMLSYWNDAEATAAAIDSACWIHTGDLATMDSDGYVATVGRSKDLIIRGGENVYPREIEELLYQHPAIQDVQVIGVPDAKYGEAIVAWIILKPAASATTEELVQFCRERVAHYKVPRHWRFTASFPLTVTG